MLRAFCTHPDLVADLVPRLVKLVSESRRVRTVLGRADRDGPQFVWCLIENVAALLRIEEDLAVRDMPERPTSAKAVKEYMLMEGSAKVSNLWKPPAPTTVKKSPGDSEGERRLRDL